MLTDREKKLHRTYRGVALGFAILGVVIILIGIFNAVIGGNAATGVGNGFWIFILSYSFYYRHDKILKKDEQGIDQPELAKLKKRHRIALAIFVVLILLLIWGRL